jgi:hypothetical protein
VANAAAISVATAAIDAAAAVVIVAAVAAAAAIAVLMSFDGPVAAVDAAFVAAFNFLGHCLGSCSLP